MILDCRGMLCPRPIIELARAFPNVPIGGIVNVIADDAAAAVDIPAWCRMRAQEYVGAAPEGDAVRYSIKRLS